MEYHLTLICPVRILVMAQYLRTSTLLACLISLCMVEDRVLVAISNEIITIRARGYLLTLIFQPNLLHQWVSLAMAVQEEGIMNEIDRRIEEAIPTGLEATLLVIQRKIHPQN